MDHHDLTGYYTYRRPLNRPEPADDFNRIRFGRAIFLWVAADGGIRGTLGFPADPLAPEKDFTDITGRVTSWAPVSIELERGCAPPAQRRIATQPPRLGRITH